MDILPIASCIGVGTTALVAHCDTVRDGGSMKPKNWKNYIPTAVAVASTVGSILLTHRISIHAMQALTAACSASGRLYNDYTTEVKKIYGEEAHYDILDRIAKDRERGTLQSKDVVVRVDDFVSWTEDDMPAGDYLFYDILNDIWFRANPKTVLNARYHFDRNFVVNSEVNVGAFYSFMGIDIPDLEITNAGWGEEFISDGMQWVDIDISQPMVDEDGESYRVISYLYPPCDYVESWWNN